MLKSKRQATEFGKAGDNITGIIFSCHLTGNFKNILREYLARVKKGSLTIENIDNTYHNYFLAFKIEYWLLQSRFQLIFVLFKPFGFIISPSTLRHCLNRLKQEKA